MSADLQQKTVTGVTWNGAVQVARQAIQLLITVILIRLLDPETFGLVGMVTVFVNFADLVRDLGLRAALIQKQDTEARHYISVFWVSIVFGLFLTLVFGAAAPLIARFYGEPALVALTAVIAVRFTVDSFGLVQTAFLMKEMRFRTLAIVQMVAVVVSGVTAIVMAFLGFGAWSLVAQPLLFSGLTVIGLWITTQWRPAFQFDWSAVRDLLGFSTNLLGFNTLNYWTRNADNLLVGRYLGTEALGLYSRAYMVILFPVRQAATIISPVLFPALSAIQQDIARVQRIYLRLTGVVALIIFPLMLGLMVVAEDFVLALFGEQWIAVVPLVRVFALVALVQSVVTLAGNLYLSQGQTALQFKVGAFVGLLTILAIVIGLQYGVNGVAYAYSAAALLLAYPSLHFAVRLIDLHVSDIVRSLLGISGCTALMGVAVLLIKIALPEGWSPFVRLALQVATGALVYMLLIWVLRLEAYRDLAALATQQLRRRRSVVAEG